LTQTGKIILNKKYIHTEVNPHFCTEANMGDPGHMTQDEDCEEVEDRKEEKHSIQG